jgi:hypothetical protein
MCRARNSSDALAFAFPHEPAALLAGIFKRAKQAISDAYVWD